jgi:hypothetical protein
MGVGVQAVVTDSDLAFIGDMGSDPGDKLQIIHRLLLGTLLAIPVTNFSLGFQKCQPLQGEQRIMYFPIRSASGLVLARTRLWTLKPV